MPWTDMRDSRRRGEHVDYAQVERELAMDEAKKKIRRAAIITWFLAAVYLMLITVALWSSAPELEPSRDPLAYVDVGLMVLLGFGIWRMNRFAALIMLLYFLSTRIYVHLVSWTPAGLGITILFGIWLYKGTRAAFAYHRLLRHEPEVPSSEA